MIQAFTKQLSIISNEHYAEKEMLLAKNVLVSYYQVCCMSQAYLQALAEPMQIHL